jgi:Tfp pilus assembly protein PilW
VDGFVSGLLGRIKRDQGGISLIEVMLGASILAVVLGAILSLSETTAKLAPNDDERAFVLDEARTGLNGMTRELRATTAVLASSAYSISVKVGTRDITYTCDVAHPSIAGRFRCTRQEGTQPATVAVDHVLNKASGAPVFTRNGNYVSVRLQVAAAGDRVEGHKHTITLDDGFFMRNVP